MSLCAAKELFDFVVELCEFGLFLFVYIKVGVIHDFEGVRFAIHVESVVGVGGIHVLRVGIEEFEHFVVSLDSLSVGFLLVCSYIETAETLVE